MLRGNGLTSLPAQLGDMASLEDLQVSSNALVELPASIGGCKALRRLIVNSNQLEALPAGLADCPKLARVNAANNRIKRLPLELVDAFEPSFAPGIAAAARRVAELGDDGGSDGRDVEGGAGAGAGAAPAPRKIEIELSSNPIEAMAADIASGASSEPAAKKPRAE